MNKYWVGFSCAVMLQGFTQDLLGKDRYIETIKVSWVNTPVWIWPLGAAFVIALGWAHERVTR